MRAINRTLEARFRSLLEGDAENGRIALIRVKKINLTHYARLLGCHYGTLQQFSGSIDEFEGVLRPRPSEAEVELLRAREFERAVRTPPGARLKRILDADVAAGALVTSRGGEISRTYYASMLGVSKAYMNAYIGVFEVYENEQSVATGHESKLDEMREWLSTKYANRELALRDGNIDRKAFEAHFKFDQRP